MVNNKTIFAIGCAVILSLAILTFSDRVTTPNKKNPYFSYGTEDNKNGLIHVIENNRVDVPIVFDIGPGIPEVVLEFSGEHDQIPGVFLAESKVIVVNNKAASKVTIQFDIKPVLKAGTHFLTVVAKDPVSGKIIRNGTILFTYNMHEVIGKCSC